MSVEARPAAARLGIVALNLLVPGLGLLRLGRLRPALTCAALPIAATLLLTGYFLVEDELGFRAYVISAAPVVLAAAGSLLVSAALSWRWSAFRSDRPWWTRWYVLLGSWLLFFAVQTSLAETARDRYRTFYLPSESMEPTLARNDLFVAAMSDQGRLSRGDLVLVRTEGTVYLKRLVAFGGDRIALRAGRVFLNGRPVEQMFVGMRDHVGLEDRIAARMLRERLPGESGTHRIIDLGPSELDELEEQLVRPDHLFVLGDNRDRSADSRVPQSMFGLEQVRRADIAGTARFVLWSNDRSKIGRSLHGG